MNRAGDILKERTNANTKSRRAERPENVLCISSAELECSVRSSADFTRAAKMHKR